MKEQLKDFILKTPQQLFKDGLTEVFLGGLMVLGGIALLLSSAFPPGFFKVTLPMLLSIGTTALLARWLEITELRLTTILPEKDTSSQHHGKRTRVAQATAIVILSGLALVVILMVNKLPQNMLVWIPSLLGLVLAVVWGFFGIRLKIRRFLALAGISVLIGITLSVLVLARIWSEAGTGLFLLLIYLVLEGVSILVSGRLSLRHQLRPDTIHRGN